MNAEAIRDALGGRKGAEAPLPTRYGALLVPVAFGLLALAERRWPLRPRTEAQAPHLARNLAFAALGALALAGLERPLVLPLARHVHRRGLGLSGALPPWPRLRFVATLALLDYTLYLWHVLTHRVPLLWRFHAVHHADLDLDTSTALRFHLGELLLSVPYRALQVRLVGASPRALTTWQLGVLLSILFHHSNVRLPGRLDAALARVVVTPRMHGIHHSCRPDERNANWSNALSLWDALHGTLRLDVEQRALTIGLPEVPPGQEVGLRRMLALPLRPRAWRPER